MRVLAGAVMVLRNKLQIRLAGKDFKYELVNKKMVYEIDTKKLGAKRHIEKLSDEDLRSIQRAVDRKIMEELLEAVEQGQTPLWSQDCLSNAS